MITSSALQALDLLIEEAKPCSLKILLDKVASICEPLGIETKSQYLRVVESLLQRGKISIDTPDGLKSKDIELIIDRINTEWPLPGVIQDVEIIILLGGIGQVVWL